MLLTQCIKLGILACFMLVSTMHALYWSTENPEESGFSPQVLGDGADGCEPLPGDPHGPGP